MSSSDDETAGVDDTIAGFAFGNVDRRGKLENNFLSDAELAGLRKLESIPGVHQLERRVQRAAEQSEQIKSETENNNSKNDINGSGFIQPLPTALDYDAEDEMIAY